MGEASLHRYDAVAPDDHSTLISSNRTAMSFERTAMSSGRTLMSVVRASLSLIAFGFTIFRADPHDLASRSGHSE
jgi:putative membrane protein